MFSSEAQLVETAIQHLKRGRSPWRKLELLTEWDYRHGRADILARSARSALVAMEAKLSRWQIACDQAYRNTAYATQAYVLLPEETACRAYRNVGHFTERQIGLCSVTRSKIVVLIEAPVVSPLMKWVTNLAHETFDGLSDANSSTRRRSKERCCTA